jgi:hypothetical protein
MPMLIEQEDKFFWLWMVVGGLLILGTVVTVVMGNNARAKLSDQEFCQEYHRRQLLNAPLACTTLEKEWK